MNWSKDKMTGHDEKNRITLREAAKLLGTSEAGVYQMVRKDRLTPISKRPMTFDRSVVEAISDEINKDIPTVPTMTLGEVAEMFGVTRSATYNWRKTGELVPIYDGHRGRQVLYSKSDVEAFAKIHKSGRVGRPRKLDGATKQYTDFLKRLAVRERSNGNEDTAVELEKFIKSVVRKSHDLERKIDPTDTTPAE